MEQHHAVVIGAGIGGLTAAAALHHQGWTVTVLERAAALAPVGAGIALAPNALRALDTIGLGDDIRALSAWQGDGGVRAPGGRWLSRTDSRAAARRFGGPLVLLHRATLIDLLLSRLPAGTLRTGSPATPAEAGGTGRPALVTTPTGEIGADLVVAADGIASPARRALFPGHPQPAYAGFTTWRMVVPGPDRPFAPHETWGRGMMWGSQPLKDGRVYAYAGAVVPAGGRAPDERAELLRRFGDWHHPVPDILAAADPATVLRHDVHTMAVPLPAYHRGRTALLGDAAHAMPPSLGQGGNQAVEDAVVLAHRLAAPGATVPDALAAYTRDRLPRTTDVTRRSARAARLSTLGSRPGVALRNTVLTAAGLLAPGLGLRALDGIADWRPPTHPYAA
ncbi:FAD-dependent monooxygenase [Streptomyces sp. NPDC018031]|uniref:FAD-dependent monooxygenase n=1 Tax=Streptomyces sp. NPDC018031 TaxID=3365033 RepID=UPI00379B6863